MILKGNQRGGGADLGRHLMNSRDNDHVELAELRGLAAETPLAAFREIEAAAKGTRCRQPFFSVSFNPPAGASVSLDQFEAAFAAVERKFGLSRQPRVVVFHEKEGRRHAHAVWSRIEADTGKAIHLSHSRLKLKEVSRALYQGLGIEPPAGVKDRAKADPGNYGRLEWRQAKRLEDDPRDLKRIVREAWAASDDRASFVRALEMQALILARGDRRGFVLVHHSGEALALKRYGGMKREELAARLGKPETVPTLDQVRGMQRDRMTAAAERRLETARTKQKAELRPLLQAVQTMRQGHRQQRAGLHERQATRGQAEELARAERLRKGIVGLWDRLTGRRGRIAETNAREAEVAKQRDRDERQALIDRQMEERQALQRQLVEMRDRHRLANAHIRTELGVMLSMVHDGVREAFQEHASEIDARKAEWRGRPDDERGEDGDRPKGKGRGRERTRDYE